MKLPHCSAAIGIGVALLVTSLNAAAWAADASAWSQDSKSAVRLISGASKNGGALRAGVEVKLQSGWHTYWRYPGDAGVPPRFSFAGSENVKAARVSFPAPKLFSDDSGNSIGYSDSVIFPVEIEPREPGKPVIARLNIEYAVCEKLCIPAEGKAELPLAAGPSTQESALSAAEARVPKKVSAAQAGLSARRVNDAAKPLVAVDMTAPSGAPVALFVEGPTADWALPVPKPTQGAPSGHRHFGFELDGLPPGVNPKAPFELTFTIVQGDRLVEVTTRLD